jgi:hypothetical protein
MKTIIIFLSLSVVVQAAPPQFIPSGASRAVKNNYGGYTYHNRNGTIAGRSVKNNFGGHTYYNNRGVTGRSYSTTPGVYRFQKVK